jgi:hypothetical protein
MIKLNANYPANILVSLFLALGVASGALAQSSGQSNDFFGNAALPNTQQVQPANSSAGSPSGSPSSSPSGLVPAPTGNGASPTDFTQDEKRMQKKNKEMAIHIKELIEKGDRMMKDGKAKNDDKMFKKGKIFKEIGEKRQAELKAAAQQVADAKKDKEKADGN